MSDTLAVVSPIAEVSLLDGDTILLEDATRVRDERGGNFLLIHKHYGYRLYSNRAFKKREFRSSLIVTAQWLDRSGAIGEWTLKNHKAAST